MGAGNSLKIIIFNNLAYLNYTVQKQANKDEPCLDWLIRTRKVKRNNI